MASGTDKARMALSLCGTFIFGTPVIAQPADAGGTPTEVATPDESATLPADGQPKNLG
jgi:hypothetical protein